MFSYNSGFLPAQMTRKLDFLRSLAVVVDSVTAVWEKILTMIIIGPTHQSSAPRIDSKNSDAKRVSHGAGDITTVVLGFDGGRGWG